MAKWAVLVIGGRGPSVHIDRRNGVREDGPFYIFSALVFYDEWLNEGPEVGKPWNVNENPGYQKQPGAGSVT